MTKVKQKTSAAGKFITLLGAAAIVMGFVLGFFISTSVTVFTDNAPVDCGSAFRQADDSVLCNNALNSRKDLAFVLLAVGIVGVIGGGFFKESVSPRQEP